MIRPCRCKYSPLAYGFIKVREKALRVTTRSVLRNACDVKSHPFAVIGRKQGRRTHFRLIPVCNLSGSLACTYRQIATRRRTTEPVTSPLVRYLFVPETFLPLLELYFQIPECLFSCKYFWTTC